MSQIFLMGVSLSDLREMVKDVIQEHLKITPETSRNQESQEYLSRAEVSQLLKISLFTLNDWTKQGHLKAYRMGRRVLYSRSEVQSSLKEVKSLKYRRGVNHGA
jgi:excisionase family DNA binding protein